jgi:hypothetical protein
MADEGVKIVDCICVKLGKEAVGMGKRDLKRRREDYVNRTVKISFSAKEGNVNTVEEMGVWIKRLDGDGCEEFRGHWRHEDDHLAEEMGLGVWPRGRPPRSGTKS